jgi:hypothetical protein
MKRKNKVHVTVYDSNTMPIHALGADWPRSKWALTEFSDWLARQVDKIPEAYRKEAEISITAQQGYENDYDVIYVIGYNRPETEEEAEEREVREHRDAKLRETDDYRELARMAAKHGWFDAAGNVRVTLPDGCAPRVAP